MKNSILIILYKVWLCLILAMVGMLAQAGSQNEPKILILGDSISAGYGLPNGTGWVSLLENAYSKKYPNLQILNASISGDTTAGGKQRLPALLNKFAPSIVVIELGGNDALRGFPLAVSKQNLLDIVNLVKQHQAKAVVVGMRVPSNYGAEYTEGFFKMFNEVSKQTNSALVPFLLEGVATDRAMFQEDGIHPTVQAQTTLLKNMKQVLDKLL
jgi:acyl-CoA thioesterase I